MHFLSCSSGRNYRVHVGKHDLSVDEDGSKTISAQKIIVHEKWSSIFVALGYVLYFGELYIMSYFFLGLIS